MKSRIVKLTVDEPCHEDWGKMTPVEQGRFCSSCSKVVIDFSGKSDHEVLRLIDAAKGAETCGQFANDQLNRSMYYPLKDTSSFSLRAVLFGATLTSILSLESCRSSKGRSVKIVGKLFIETEDTLRRPEPVLKGNMTTEYDHSKETEITGQVLDRYNKPLTDVTVILDDEMGNQVARVEANRKGKFEIPLDWSKNPVKLRVFAFGYSERSRMLSEEKDLTNMQIVLPTSPRKMGKVKTIED